MNNPPENIKIATETGTTNSPTSSPEQKQVQQERDRIHSELASELDGKILTLQGFGKVRFLPVAFEPGLWKFQPEIIDPTQITDYKGLELGLNSGIDAPVINNYRKWKADQKPGQPIYDYWPRNVLESDFLKIPEIQAIVKAKILQIPNKEVQAKLEQLFKIAA